MPLVYQRHARIFTSVQTLSDGRVFHYSKTVKYMDERNTGSNLVPSWKWRILRQWSATGTLIGYKYTFGRPKACKSFTRTTAFTWTRCESTAGYAILPNLPQATHSALAEYRASKALTNCYKQLTTHFRGGNALAEWRETVRMLARPHKLLFSRTMSFVGRVGKSRKVYKRDPVRYGEALGSSWLAYSFGISPILSDIEDARKQLIAIAEARFPTVSIKGKGVDELIVSDYEQGLVDGHELIRQRICETDHLTVSYDGEVRANVPGCPSGFAEGFGLGVSDILPAVWEAIPWSFMVDYFVNVGEVLDSFHSLSAELVWLKRTVRNRRTVSGSAAYGFQAPQPGYPTGYPKTMVSGGEFRTHGIRVSRSSVPQMPWPGFRFRVPFGSDLKVANIAALTLAIYKSKPEALRNGADADGYTE